MKGVWRKVFIPTYFRYVSSIAKNNNAMMARRMYRCNVWGFPMYVLTNSLDSVPVVSITIVIMVGEMFVPKLTDKNCRTPNNMRAMRNIIQRTVDLIFLAGSATVVEASTNAIKNHMERCRNANKSKFDCMEMTEMQTFLIASSPPIM